MAADEPYFRRVANVARILVDAGLREDVAIAAAWREVLLPGGHRFRGPATQTETDIVRRILHETP